ncbi:MAG: mycothiol synthase [Actinomycetota bacterium]|nr:mycothiol synthase [Actinomycetota bacterium]
MNKPSWTSVLDAAQQGQVRELVTAATDADGVAPVSEQVLLALAEKGRHLLVTKGGVITGYAQLGADELMAEVVVAPEHRRRGTGSALVTEALRSGPEVRVWAHGDGIGAQGLARRLGLVSRRELWQMRLDLSGADLPELAVPQGVRLRTYEPVADDDAVLAVNNAAFAWHPEQGGWGPDELAQRRAEAWFDTAGFFLAVDDDDQLLGFHWTKVHPPEGGDPALGEVYVVGVSPQAQGRGLGRVLTLAGLHHLRAAGLSTALLYVESDNTAAVHTYTKLGFTNYHVDVAYGR